MDMVLKKVEYSFTTYIRPCMTIVLWKRPLRFIHGLNSHKLQKIKQIYKVTILNS